MLVLNIEFLAEGLNLSNAGSLRFQGLQGVIALRQDFGPEQQQHRQVFSTGLLLEEISFLQATKQTAVHTVGTWPWF